MSSRFGISFNFVVLAGKVLGLVCYCIDKIFCRSYKDLPQQMHVLFFLSRNMYETIDIKAVCFLETKIPAYMP